MDLTLDGLVSLSTLTVGLVGLYSAYVSKIKVMEIEIEMLKDMVDELRSDIKELLARK